MANRYSNYTPSVYTPMTLEEIAMVPAMKRKQHDEVLAKQELIRSGLAKTDPYKKHFDEALKLKKGIEDKMDLTAQELAEKGIDNDMIGKTIGLNREFQDLMSPTGKLGQINAEKINIAKINEEYDKLGKEKGWGQDRINYWKNKALDEYNDLTKSPIYDDSGRLVSYGGAQSIANKIDYGDELHKLATAAGMTTKEFLSNVDTSGVDPSSGYNVMIKNTTGWKRGNNAQQVADAYETLRKRLSDPTSETYKSMVYEGRNAKDLIDELKTQSGIYFKSETGDTTGRQMDAFGGDPNAGKETGPAGTIINNDSELKSDALDVPDYTGGLTEENRLKAKGKLTATEMARYQDLKELRQNADAKLNTNKDYIALNAKYKKQENAMIEYRNKYFEKKSDGSYYLKKGSPVSAQMKLQDMGADLAAIGGERQKHKDAAWKESSSLRHNYSYLPTTPKEESEWNLHNENVFNVMRGVNLGNILDLTSIATTGGTRKDVGHKDVKQIQELLRSGDPKSFKINNVKTFGDGRTPEVTMTFNSGEEAEEYDIAGATDWDDEYGGSKKPVTVTFKLKKFSNAFDSGSAAGYKNLSGAIADFWKNKGGVNQITGNFQGTEVSNAFIENMYSGVSDQELEKRAAVDSDAREALMIRIARRQAKKGK